MNAFQPCPNTSDLVPLYLPHQLYLKPIARLNMSLQLPNVKKLGKSISHWEIMDRIRDLIKPEEFTVFKVTKTTVEFVRFEAELETRTKIEYVLKKLENRMIKLKDFSEPMRLRACEWKSDFPNRRAWDDFFQNAKDMNEMKPGERPDTLHISNVPTQWFVPRHLSKDDDITPSEKIFYRVFQKFGSIRYVDVPISDPYRKKMKDHISGMKNSSFDNKEFFEGYVQFKDYIGFTKAMDAFRDKKLVYKEEENSAIEVNIKVDFDRSKHLSDASIRRREIVRERLVKKAKEKEDKEQAELEEKRKKEEMERKKEIDVKVQKEMRRKLREEKRKVKILQKLEITGADEINEKIANEEKMLLKVQRKLEAIRLVEELFRRIKDKNPGNVQLYEGLPNPGYEELKRFKNTSELEVLTQREKLHHALKGRVMLKTILSDKGRPRKDSTSSSDSNFSLEEILPKGRPRSPVAEKYPELMYEPNWLGYQYPFPGVYPDLVDPFGMRGYMPRTRGPFPRLPMLPGPSRGMNYGGRRRPMRHRGGGYRGGGRGRPFHQEINEEYEKYFNQFLNEHENRMNRSYSRDRSRDKSRDRMRSRDRSRERSRDRSRSRSRRRYSRSYTRSRSRSRSRRSRSHSKRSSRSRSRSRGRSRRSHSRDRSRSRSTKRSSRRIHRDSSESRSRHKSRSRSKSKDNEKRESPQKERSKSVDSSKFMTPKQFSQQRSERRERSKSWSLPREGETKRRSWSKSPETKS